jgi:hypothetical protein
MTRMNDKGKGMLQAATPAPVRVRVGEDAEDEDEEAKLPELSKIGDRIVKLFSSLDEDQRVDVVDHLDALYCLRCGDDAHDEDEDCPLFGDDEDEGSVPELPDPADGP